MWKPLVLAGLASASIASVSGYQRLSLGDRLERDYTEYYSLPIDADSAKAAGWVPLNTTCEAPLGVTWAQSSKGATESQPILLYFTPGGQITGAGALYRGSYPDNLVNNGYLQPVPGNDDGSEWFVTVTFRSPEDVCSSGSLALPLGDRLVLNANTIAQEIPLTPQEAGAAGWVAGSCFSGMGTHWFLDVSQNGSMSWEAANLFPIVTMYNEETPTATGTINAFFFASSIVQQSLLPPSTNEWEPIPLPNILMCKNFCDSSCHFSDTSFYSTLHLYMNDRTAVSCNGGCTIGCCS